MNKPFEDPLVPSHIKSFTDQGEVIKVVRPEKEWRVRFQATDWTARSLNPLVLHPGDRVRVTNIQNITLWIEPI
jgi:membrane protein implicated in regulation of membrane protease activity